MNNKTQFTPGPWDCDNDWAVGKRAINGSLDLIANLSYSCFQDAKQADANLIAAAPAMYAELVNGLGLLEASYHDMCDKYGKDSMQAEIVWDQVERTRNVIAQAEGRHHE